MDIEEGLEVIWNEVKFSESKDYRAQEKQMSSALDSMISITHPNIVKVKISCRKLDDLRVGFSGDFESWIYGSY